MREREKIEKDFREKLLDRERERERERERTQVIERHERAFENERE